MSEEKQKDVVANADNKKIDEIVVKANDKQMAPKKRSRWLRWLVRVFLFFVLLLCVALAGLWVWSGQEGSLAQTVSLAQRFVPLVGESLHVEGAQGSLRKGGEVELIRWQQGRIDVEVSKVSLDWNLNALLRGVALVEHLNAQSVVVKLQPQEGASQDEGQRTEPFKMPVLPENFALPVRVDVNRLKVDSFVYGQGESALKVENIEVNYHHDRKRHQLKLVSLHFDQGDYWADVSLTAYNPTLNALLEGTLESKIPGSEQRTRVDVSTTLQGALSNIMLTAQAKALLLQDAAVGDVSQGQPQQEALPTQVVTEQIIAQELDETVKPVLLEVAAVNASSEIEPSANLEANITLWDAQIVPHASLNLHAFNLGAVWTQAPQTLLSGSAQVIGVELGGSFGVKALQVTSDIENGTAGSFDLNLIPLSQLKLSAVLEDRDATLETLQLELGQVGAVTAQGSFVLPERGDGTFIPLTHLEVKVSELNPQAILASLDEDRINGYLNLDHAQNVLSYDLSLNARNSTKGAGLEAKILSVALRGKVDESQIKLDELKVKGVHSDLTAQGSLQLSSSVLAALQGQGEKTVVELLKEGIANASIDLKAPGIETVLEAKQLRATSGTLSMDLKADDVQKTLNMIALFPWAPPAIKEFAVEGGFDLVANLQGGWERGDIDAKLEMAELAVMQDQAVIAVAPSDKENGEATQVNLQSSSKEVSATASNASAASGTKELVRIKNMLLTLQGKMTDAQLTLKTQAMLGQNVVDLETQGRALQSGNSISMRFDELGVVLSAFDAQNGQNGQKGAQAQAKPVLGAQLKDPVTLVWEGEKSSLNVASSALEIRFANNKERSFFVNWEKTSWQNGVIDSGGSIDAFPALWLLAFTGKSFDDFRLGGDMMVAGKWKINTGEQPRILFDFSHTGGVLTLEGKNTAFASSAVAQRYDAGINAAYLKVYNEGRALKLDMQWDTVNAGVISVDLATVLTREGKGWTVSMDSPLSGDVVAQLPELSIASAFFPTGWRFEGAAIIDTAVLGVIKAPELKGRLTALGVSLRSVIDGISFTDGEVDIAFNKDEVRLNKLILHGEGDKGGEMIAQGFFTLPEKGVLPLVELNLQLKNFQASIHRDRQLVLSGKLQMGLKNKVMSLTGNIDVDRALLIIDGDGAPGLDSDVVVVSGKYATPVQEDANRPRRRDIYGIIPLLKVKLNLGNNFRVQGFGLQTYLKGGLELNNSGWEPMLFGTINTDRGRFKAYGQHLVVEKGKIVFSGNYTNPALDVLAIRAQTQERVGVNIVGTAMRPKIVLYSESGLSDSEALSWLILGRSASSDGTEMAILQQAALALASGDGEGFTDKLAGAVGLDEISLGGGGSGDEEGVGATTVMIGKRLSEKFYISYEQGLSSGVGTFFAFYDISRRLTFRFEAGKGTAFDLIYTLQFDGGKR